MDGVALLTRHHSQHELLPPQHDPDGQHDVSALCEVELPAAATANMATVASESRRLRIILTSLPVET